MEHTPLETYQETTPLMRTAEGDMSKIHGYGAYRDQHPEDPAVTQHTEEIIRSASQDSLLKKTPLTEKPNYGE